MVNVIPPAGSDSAREVVLIITDDHTDVDEVVSVLEQKRYDVKTAIFDGKTLKNTPRKAPSAVLCYFTKVDSAIDKIVSTLKERYQPRNIPFIGALNRTNEHLKCFDSLIFPPAHPAQIANRVNSMVRINVMQTEIALRIDTLWQDFRVDYDFTEMSFEDPFRVLFIGKATPEFMVIINALQTRDVEVVAAFTSFSAFDFLHEHAFDAVVMNALTTVEPAMTISETMRRNSKLYHVPTLFLIGDDFDSYDMAYQKGATDLIASSCTEDQISGRILELANYHRIHRQLKTEFEKIGCETCFDKDSRTYSSDFFSAHLARACKYYPTQGLPLSLITVKANPAYDGIVPPEAEKKAYDQLADLIKNMVRMQDAVGRLTDNKFAITFPAQEKARLETVIDRLFGVIDCTAFDLGDGSSKTFRLQIKVNLTQQIEEESAPDLLKRTLQANTPQSSGSNEGLLSANDPEALVTRQRYV